MKAEIKIPRGFRKLRTGDIRREGDKWTYCFNVDWLKTFPRGTPVPSGIIYIRRKRKARA